MYFDILYNSDQGSSSDSDEQPMNVPDVFNEDEPAIVIEPNVDVKSEPSDNELDIVEAETALGLNVKEESNEDININKKNGQTSIDPLDVRARPCNEINNRRVHRVSWRQLKILSQFLNSNRAIATAHNRALQDKEFSQRKWKQIAKVLNSQSDGTHKDWAGWSKPPELLSRASESIQNTQPVLNPPVLTPDQNTPVEPILEPLPPSPSLELMVQDPPARSPTRTPIRSPRPATTSAARSPRRRRRRREPPMSQEDARRALVRSTQIHAEAAVRTAEAMEKTLQILGEFSNTTMRIERSNGRAIPVDCTPGDSSNVKEENVLVYEIPDGDLGAPLHMTDVPVCSDVLEQVEAMDLSEDEAEELLEPASWHDRRWGMNFGSEDQKCSILNSLTPSASAEDDRGCAHFDSVRTRQGVNKVPFAGSDVTANTEVDVRSSTSGVTAMYKPLTRREIGEGSDVDSEFDDEFDTCPTESIALTGFQKEIPDNDELEEPIRDVISNIEKGMDDAADRLLGVSSSFNWVEGYESFRGVPEQFSGPTPGPLNDYDSPYDAFIDIWDRDIIERIALETNRYAKQTIDALKDKGKLKPSSRVHTWTDTNSDEILVLFGVFMYMGLDRRTSVEEYWKTDDYLELTKFRRLFTRKRYSLLNKFLHFVDNSDTSQSLLETEEISSAKVFSRRLSKLSPIIEHLGNKFSSLYHLERNIVVDESLTLFKGRLGWVQTIMTKPARFGIKSYELRESRTGYMARFQIYTGKSNGVNHPSVSVDLGYESTKVVLELLQGLEHRGHCVTMDNFYNSPSLARYLKIQGFDCLGTLRINRRNVPNDIANMPKNMPKGTLISRQCGDVSIVACRDSKLVRILSTYHDDSTYVGSVAGNKFVKPICMKDYNSTMGAVNLTNRKLYMYLSDRKRCVKWYVKMFKRLLNVSIHNAFIMYVSSLTRRNKVAVTQREFRYELAKALIDQHRPCQSEIREPIEGLMRLRRDVVHEPKYLRGRNGRKRCAVCQRQKIEKKVHSLCATCNVYLCFENCWATWHTLVDLGTQRKRGRKRKCDE